MSACSNSPVAPLIWRAWESGRDRKGCLISKRQITCMRRAFFFPVFLGCTEFGIWCKQDQIFQKKHVKRKWRWTSSSYYGIKIISWRLGGRHTQPQLTIPFISAHVGLLQQSGCAIDLESLGIRQRQKRLFNLEAPDNLYETGVFFPFSLIALSSEFGASRTRSFKRNMWRGSGDGNHHHIMESR